MTQPPTTLAFTGSDQGIVPKFHRSSIFDADF
jgi:hypothetical protein